MSATTTVLTAVPSTSGPEVSVRERPTARGAATALRPARRARAAAVDWRDDDVAPEALLVAAATGDEAAFAVLVERVRPQVLRITRNVVRDPSIAEEVTQEVLTELWAKSDRFDPLRGSLAAWVATLSRRRAVDRVRSEQAGRDRDDRVARRNQEREIDVVADEVEVRLEHWQVRRALADLSERQREAVELAYFGGHTYRDVARMLGIPEGTAKSRLRDGLLRLRELLSDLA
jgi:RNA polymerase sigma-70 factor, ECF subfamily